MTLRWNAFSIKTWPFFFKCRAAFNTQICSLFTCKWVLWTGVPGDNVRCHQKLYCILGDRVSTEHTGKAGLGSKSQGPSCLYLCSTGIWDHHTQHIYWGPNSCLPACVASRLWTKLSLQSIEAFLRNSRVKISYLPIYPPIICHTIHLCKRILL